MRVLWVTPQQPGPSGGGGSLHEFELLRALSSRHEIDVVTSYDAADVAGLDVELEIVGFRTGRPARTTLQTMAALARAREPLHASVLKERIPALRAAIARRRDVDLVHVMMGEIAPVLDAVTAPTSLLLFDSYVRHADALLATAAATGAAPRRRIRYRLERRLAANFERRWYPLASALACVTPDDAAALGRLLDRPVDVIRNPIGEELFAAPAVARSDDLVLFVGSMGYPPNADAVRWLEAEIWPRVVAARPGARLLAVGRSNDAPDVVDGLRQLLGERLVLDVDDIRPYYWQAAVTIAPVRLGGGLRNKVIHAMACGSPVVSTPAAAEGTGAAHGEHLLLAADADAFAGAIVEVLDRPDEAAARAERARDLVEPLRVDRVAAEVEAWWERARHGVAPVR